MYSDLQKQYESLKKEIGVNNVTDNSAQPVANQQRRNHDKRITTL